MLLGGIPFGAYFQVILAPPPPQTGRPIEVFGLDTYVVIAEEYGEEFRFRAELTDEYAVGAWEDA